MTNGWRGVFVCAAAVAAGCAGGTEGIYQAANHRDEPQCEVADDEGTELSNAPVWCATWGGSVSGTLVTEGATDWAVILLNGDPVGEIGPRDFVFDGRVKRAGWEVQSSTAQLCGGLICFVQHGANGRASKCNCVPVPRGCGCSFDTWVGE